MLDVNALPSYYVGKLGLAKVAEVCGKSSSLVAMWQKRSKFPLDAVSRLLEFDPSPLEQIRPLYDRPTLGTKLAILMPCNGDPKPEVMETLLRLYNPAEMVFKRTAFNNLSVARNSLLAWWLNGPCEWALWNDADNPLPCGDAAYFKEITDQPNMPDVFAGVNTINRLLVHKLKRGIADAMVVSSVYVGRKKGAPPQFAGGNSPEMRALIRRGPQDKLIERPWVGFGGVLTHRKVFEDVISQQGHEITVKSDDIRNRFGYTYSVFTPIDQDSPGDDVPACNRIRRAGHKIYVDLAVFAGHVGSKVFSHSDL